MMFDIPELTEDMVRYAVPLISDSASEEIRESEEYGHQAWLAAVDKHKQEICKVLGITPPDKYERPWREEYYGLLRSFAATNQWPEFSAVVNSGDMEGACAATINAPICFWEFLNSKLQASKKLSELNGTVGACTPKLCKLLMDAPKDVPFTLFLAHASGIHVDDVPDVPLTFIDDFPELLDSEDYNAAFMQAYITACLRLFFDDGRVQKHLGRLTPEQMRRQFPIIVWELSGHTICTNESIILDTITCW